MKNEDINHWAITLNSALTSHPEVDKIILNTANSPKMKIGDKIVAIQKGKPSSIFFWQAGILEIESRPVKGRPDRHETILRLSNRKDLKEEVSLEEVQFSLLKIKNFQKPSLHFNRPYVWLAGKDFETIITNDVYLSRTAFLAYYFALPFEMQQLVKMDFLAARAPRYRSFVSYRESWAFLKSWIHSEYSDFFLLLSETQSLAEALSPNIEGWSAKRILFGKENAEELDSLETQALLAREASELLAPILDGASDGWFAEFSENEKRFEELFLHENWVREF